MSQPILEAGNYLDQPRTKMLCEKWSKRINFMTEQLKDEKSTGIHFGFERKAALAKILENTQNFIKTNLGEAVQSTDIGQYKRYALDIVTTVIPNLIAFEVVSVQPLENRVGMVNYIKYTYNTDKGKTTAGTEFASSLNLGPTDVNYTSQTIQNEAMVIAESAEVKNNLSWHPVIPGSVTITHGDVVITDDGLGKLKAATGLTGEGTIDYATGAVTYTLSEEDTSSVPTADYKYNNEFLPMEKIPEIGLKIVSLPITAQPRRLKAFYSFEGAYELKKEYGQDMQQILNAEAAAEIQREIDVEICLDLLRGAGASTPLTWSKKQPVGVNMIDHYDSFAITLEDGSSKIYQKTRRVHANFVICGTNVRTVIGANRQFVPSNVTNVVGPYFFGTLNGLKIYVNPEYPVDAFVLGYKGDNLLHAGYIYAPYMPIMTSDLVQLEDLAGRKGWVTMYGKILLNRDFYCAGQITA